MAFQKVIKPLFPQRRWSLVGYADDGKSTFALQMARPTLFIDSDQRIEGRLTGNEDDVYKLGDEPSDAVDVLRIQALMVRDMPNSGIQTVVVDSLTSIIGPVVNKTLAENNAGLSTNKSSGFNEKATNMRLLQDALTPYGTDILFIWHFERNQFSGREGVRQSLTPIERERLVRSLNAELEVVWDGSTRGVKISWSRDGVAGAVLWDNSGFWKNMPERVEVAMYGFPKKEDAIAWAVQHRRKFETTEAAEEAYAALKAERAPKTAAEMWVAWGDLVLA